MTLATYTAMVCNLMELCGSRKRCVGCSPVTAGTLRQWLGDDLFSAVVQQSPLITGALQSPHCANVHCTLREFLDELQRLISVET